MGAKIMAPIAKQSHRRLDHPASATTSHSQLALSEAKSRCRPDHGLAEAESKRLPGLDEAHPEHPAPAQWR